MSLFGKKRSEAPASDRGDDKAYRDKLEQELRIFSKNVHVHDLPDIFHYWSNKYLRPRFEALGIQDIPDVFVKASLEAREQKGGPVRIVSVGAGNCDFEVSFLERLALSGCTDAHIDCVDVVDEMLERGRKLASEKGLQERMGFVKADLNSIQFGNRYDLFFANQSLHHFVELETIFDKIRKALPDHGYFVTSDMIGRNGHLRWPEALDVVHDLWKLLPARYRFNHQLQRYEETFIDHDCSTEGFEGIRAQDILPLLIERFQFEFFAPFSNVIDVFIDRSFGHNFSEKDPFDVAFIDFVAHLDLRLLRERKITPTHLVAAMTKGKPRRYLSFGEDTPAQCVRIPD